MGKGLVFKGDKPKSKKKKKKSKHDSGPSSTASLSDAVYDHRGDEAEVAMAGASGGQPTAKVDGASGGQPTAAAAAAASASPVHLSAAASTSALTSAVSKLMAGPTIEDGVGRILTSGTVLNGQGTKLSKTLRSGDAIIVSVDGKDEMRVLTMVLSDVSAALSTPFSSDLKVPVRFKYIPKPRNVARERAEHAKKVKVTKEEEERSAFGTYGSNEFVYRETTEHGSYRIRREQLDGEVSRGDLLDRRTKKKSDKYC